MVFIIIVLVIVIIMAWSSNAKKKAQIEREREQRQREADIAARAAAEQAKENIELNLQKLQLMEEMSTMTKRTPSRAEQGHKDGFIYVVSNPLSFGDDVFKVGMTRREDYNKRINELNNASVPFNFQIEQIIHSDQAASTERDIHAMLEEYRLNKDNKRKEFFKIDKSELNSIIDEVTR